jgi:hypothetical protein
LGEILTATVEFAIAVSEVAGDGNVDGYVGID